MMSAPIQTQKQRDRGCGEPHKSRVTGLAAQCRLQALPTRCWARSLAKQLRLNGGTEIFALRQSNEGLDGLGRATAEEKHGRDLAHFETARKAHVPIYIKLEHPDPP
mmetsp:Transcript_104096/g.212404  ORF Transcript_104096/g.212404 Transcript_104096/m.212404 type:complete len:107 (+) Transcript_104096:1-321(+)